MKNFFSIILPTYNRAHFLSAAINSVINQTFTDWELIIIDDGSTDNTKEVVDAFTAGKINYIWQTNQERSAARNKGIDNASGEFICFLDSDDLWRNNHLETLYNAIKLNDGLPALYFTGMCWNFPHEKKDVIFKSPKDTNPIEYVIANQIGTPTVGIHHSILKVLRFNTLLRINEDVELFARIAANNKIIRIPYVTVDVIVHRENTKGQTKDYVKPQIEAMHLIFNNPLLKDKISTFFKRNVFKNLRHQHINHYIKIGNFTQMQREITLFLFLYPFDKSNKIKLVTLLYSLPGGRFLKQIVAKVKK